MAFSDSIPLANIQVEIHERQNYVKEFFRIQENHPQAMICQVACTPTQYKALVSYLFALNTGVVTSSVDATMTGLVATYPTSYKNTL